MRRVLGIVAIVLIALWIGTAPKQAAKVARNGGDKIATIARGFGTFFTDLAT